MEIVAMDRPDIVKAIDLTTTGQSLSRQYQQAAIIQAPAEMTPEEFEVLDSDPDSMNILSRALLIMKTEVGP